MGRNVGWNVKEVYYIHLHGSQSSFDRIIVNKVFLEKKKIDILYDEKYKMNAEEHLFIFLLTTARNQICLCWCKK